MNETVRLILKPPRATQSKSCGKRRRDGSTKVTRTAERRDVYGLACGSLVIRERVRGIHFWSRHPEIRRPCARLTPTRRSCCSRSTAATVTHLCPCRAVPFSLFTHRHRSRRGRFASFSIRRSEIINNRKDFSPRAFGNCCPAISFNSTRLLNHLYC